MAYTDVCYGTNLMTALVCALTMNGSPSTVCTVVVVMATLANTVSKSLCPEEETTLLPCSIAVRLSTPLTLLGLLLPQFFKRAAFLLSPHQ